MGDLRGRQHSKCLIFGSFPAKMLRNQLRTGGDSEESRLPTLLVILITHQSKLRNNCSQNRLDFQPVAAIPLQHRGKPFATQVAAKCVNTTLQVVNVVDKNKRQDITDSFKLRRSANIGQCAISKLDEQYRLRRAAF